MPSPDEFGGCQYSMAWDDGVLMGAGTRTPITGPRARRDIRLQPSSWKTGSSPDLRPPQSPDWAREPDAMWAGIGSLRWPSASQRVLQPGNVVSTTAPRALGRGTTALVDPISSRAGEPFGQQEPGTFPAGSTAQPLV